MKDDPKTQDAPKPTQTKEAAKQLKIKTSTQPKAPEPSTAPCPWITE